MAASKAAAKVAAPQAAAKSFDDARWQQYVRLACVEIAAQRAVSAHAALSAAELLAVAADLEWYVLDGLTEDDEKAG